mgnify:CR=1 FL=1
MTNQQIWEAINNGYWRPLIAARLVFNPKPRGLKSEEWAPTKWIHPTVLRVVKDRQRIGCTDEIAALAYAARNAAPWTSAPWSPSEADKVTK